MISKKKIFGVSIVLLVVCVFLFLRNNILILDDRHPESNEWVEVNNEIHEETQGMPLNESPGGEEKKEESKGQSPTINKKGYHIFINLDKFSMYVYKNGELIKTYPVSGGKASTPSPLGSWKIISKDTWGEGFGGAWLGFNVPWGKYGIHGTIYPWLIGNSNASKGCIRMKNNHVKELYKLVPHGTVVTIEHAGWVFRTLKSGDVGSDVYMIQTKLKKLGYYKGYPDGRFGTSLKQCITKFQKEHKLTAKGVVNRQTYNKIDNLFNEKEEKPEEE
ncbi:MAG: L,D-transpeptidase family protein [Clostridia bacterium]|nr:L,D-transpeptidase family protein [Clostridia bacterium]